MASASFSSATVWLVAGLFIFAQSAVAQSQAVVEARGLILKEDYSAAAQKLIAPVKANEPDALMLQGVLHAVGAGATYEYPLALDYWRTAALAGHRDAARLLLPSLNNQYAREWWAARIARMPKPAIEVPAKLVTTERGGLVADRDKAKKWITREAEAGNPVGLYNAYHAASFGARSDDAAKARVRRLLERAAEMKLTTAMRELSSELEQSLPVPMPISMGFEKNSTRAAELMKEAADRGDMQAQLLWAHWLNSKKYTARNPKAAVEYYQRSSEQGDDHAAYFLYEAYSEGNGVDQDEGKASEYLRVAAERGNDLAVAIYALRLFKGEGMKSDQTAAIKMLEENLVCDVVPNTDVLALMAYAYASGSGVKQDIDRALWWGRWAEEHGSTYAKELVAKLTERKTDVNAASVERK